MYIKDGRGAVYVGMKEGRGAVIACMKEGKGAIGIHEGRQRSHRHTRRKAKEP